MQDEGEIFERRGVRPPIAPRRDQLAHLVDVRVGPIGVGLALVPDDTANWALLQRGYHPIEVAALPGPGDMRSDRKHQSATAQSQHSHRTVISQAQHSHRG